MSGSKYGLRGGYGKQCLSPKLPDKLAKVLVEAANHSLATSTWKQYMSVWARLKKITKETGVVFSLPMSGLMVQTFVGFFLSKGLKADTVRTYLSAVKSAHTSRGLDAPALSDMAVGAAIRGRKNAESLEEESRSVATVMDMRTIKQNLFNAPMRTDAKRSVWAVAVLLFMGSLRGSEILSYDSSKFDPVKTLLGGDISLIKATGPDGKEIELLSIRLKQPKTARSNPHQVVELAETGGFLCPIKAWKSWRGGRKFPVLGGRPVFTWKGGNLITMNELNSLLATLLPDAPIRLTTRAFRPALPTLLAREGVNEQVLQALGRWTSNSYNNYVRHGRSGDWRGLVVKIKSLAI